ncbi:MAG: hypothetical protein HY903_04510 [Deltaproteobacteria bacterium]|nr:hypothetical protein [Deltaproteobacteria bacterium]
MSAPQPALREYLAEHDLMLFGGAPAVYHCHHFNLFLDQTIDDALGQVAGERLRFSAAREFAHDFLVTACAREGATTPVERISVAQTLFAAMGQGKLQLSVDPAGGQGRGEFLHYGYSWFEKYGTKVKRLRPADAFAAGFAAAANEVAFGLPLGSTNAVEGFCIARRDPHCAFTLTAGSPTPAGPKVGAAEIRANVRPAFTGKSEDEVVKIAAGLRDFTASVRGDHRGLVQAFGVYVTLHLSGYYNRISFDAVRHIEATTPQSVGVLEELLRESGHVCVFNTFGGILLSPEWEGMVGKLSGDPTQVVLGCAAIARALGFGHWTIADLQPGRRLVMRSPATYESAYFIARHGRAARGNDYFFQGAVLAVAQLAHRVDWKSKPKLTQEFYQSLFRGGIPWRAEQTRGIAKGDEMSEIVVSSTNST